MRRLFIIACLLLLMSGASPSGAQIIGDTVADGSEFVFARLIYGTGGGLSLNSFRGYGRRGGASWSVDWPKADKQFMFGIDRLSNVRIVLDKDIAVPIMDPKLFDYPFIYAVEVGRGGMNLSMEEAARLREYMDRGGFFVVDDFWGTQEWSNFAYDLQKIFPDKVPEQIPLDHELLHAFFDIDEILQIPNVNNGCYGGSTSERDGYVPYLLGIFDDNRRPMMVINWNTDLGDAWEWSDLECYPADLAGFAYRMGMNFIVYSMTH